MRKFAIVAALLAIFISITIYTFLNVYEHTTGWAAFGVAITGFLPLLLLLSLVLQFHDMKSRLENKEKLHNMSGTVRLVCRNALNYDK
jgi:hypothetical protein